MKKKIGIILLATTIVASPTIAKGPTIASLQKTIKGLTAQITSLKTQVNNLQKDKYTLLAENKKLTSTVADKQMQIDALNKALEPVIKTTIYEDGFNYGTTEMIFRNNEPYVNLNTMFKMITDYSKGFTLSTDKKSLYFGIIPSDGHISLTRMPLKGSNNSVKFNSWNSRPFMLNKKRYNWGIGGESYGNYTATYHLDGKYKTLSFLFGQDDESKDSDAFVSLEGDNQLLYSATNTKYDAPCEVTLDVSNIDTLQITIGGDGIIANPLMQPK